MKRYFVDERGGCVAVRDRSNTDPEYQGLHEDTGGVVKYWHGEQEKRVCESCGHVSWGGWKVSEEFIEEANRLCDQLNEGLK